MNLCADWPRGTIHGILNPSRNMMTNANISKVEEVGTDRVLMLSYKRRRNRRSPSQRARRLSAFDKAPADQLAVGRKVFIVMNKDGSEAACGRDRRGTV